MVASLLAVPDIHQENYYFDRFIMFLSIFVCFRELETIISWLPSTPLAFLFLLLIAMIWSIKVTIKWVLLKVLHHLFWTKTNPAPLILEKSLRVTWTSLRNYFTLRNLYKFCYRYLIRKSAIVKKMFRKRAKFCSTWDIVVVTDCQSLLNLKIRVFRFHRNFAVQLGISQESPADIGDSVVLILFNDHSVLEGWYAQNNTYQQSHE